MPAKLFDKTLDIQKEHEAIHYININNKSYQANRFSTLSESLPEAKVYTLEEYNKEKENGEFSKPYDNVDAFFKDLLDE